MSSSAPNPLAEPPHPESAFDIRNKFLGPMPVDFFLREFVPVASAARPQGTFPFSRTSVSQNEDEFIEAIRASRLSPDLHIVNTASAPRKKRHVKPPDMLVFSRDHNQGSESQQPAEHDWGNVELWIKTKRTKDPFLTVRKLQRYHSASDADYYDRRTKGYKTCNLLIAYATALHRSQFRIFSFSVVTFENVRKGHLHRILVWDDLSPDDGPRRYIAPRAMWVTGALIGRAIFGYIAFDVERGELVYLKDFWRVDRPESQKEGDVYRELHEAEVQNIAKMGPAGDVRHVRVSSTEFQRTRTQDYVRGPGSLHAWCHGRPSVVPYVHYRLVLETVGMPLSHFKSTRQLCEVIRDAVVAHTDAYNKARILHRDIRERNILISDSGAGILIDWDLSSKVQDNPDRRPGRYSRTGTWEFFSIARINGPRSRQHAVSDDLESFFWVLMYEIVRYRDRKPLFPDEYIRRVFGRPTGYFDRPHTGKLTCVFDHTFASFLINIFVKTPCLEIIEEMRSLFGGLYGNLRRGPSEGEARESLRTSDAFLAIFEKHLQSEWDIDDDDDGSWDRPGLQPDGSASRKRLKRKAEDRSDSEEENIHVRRIGRYPPSTEESASDEDSSRTCCSSDSDSEWDYQSVSHDGNSSDLSSRDSQAEW